MYQIAILLFVLNAISLIVKLQSYPYTPLLLTFPILPAHPSPLNLWYTDKRTTIFERKNTVKKFNTEGTCNPNSDYMVDISDKLSAITKMVDEENYFTINRARQNPGYPIC